MFLGHRAKYAGVAMNGNDAGLSISELIHPHLEHVLPHLEAKKHSEKCVPPFVGVEYC